MGDSKIKPTKEPLSKETMDKMIVPKEMTYRRKHYTLIKEYKDWALYENDFKGREGFTKASLAMKQLGLLKKGEKYEGISRYSNL